MLRNDFGTCVDFFDFCSMVKNPCYHQKYNTNYKKGDLFGKNIRK